MTRLFEWVVNAGAIAGAIHALVAVWNRLLPRVPFDVAQQARLTLTDARFVIETSISTGGGQSHPWRIAERTVECTEVVNRLQLVRASLRGRRLNRLIDATIDSLNGIWATQPAPYLLITFDGNTESAHERETRQTNEKRSAVQREHAQLGLEAVSKAIAALDWRTAKH